MSETTNDILHTTLKSSKFYTKRKIRAFIAFGHENQHLFNLPALLSCCFPKGLVNLQGEYVLVIPPAIVCIPAGTISLCFTGPAASAHAAEGHIAFVNLQLPVDRFATSHIAGAGLGYSWSRRRFGNAVSSRKPGLIASAGADYYVGKKITTAGYDFRFGSYLDAYLLGGAVYNFTSKAMATLSAGPGLGIYKGNSRVGVHVALHGNYFITERLAISPGIIYRTHTQENALWSIVLRAGYTF